MVQTCFVIMGYGIKNGLNLDLTYGQIIKPCIIRRNLQPYKLYDTPQFNAYRCDEIAGTMAIDYKYVTCLKNADIVIADISTMNVNAIYELGARHALKPRSTILLCARKKKKQFRFFDLSFVPIIFYNHKGSFIAEDDIKQAMRDLDNALDVAINAYPQVPDSPIQRALLEEPNICCSGSGEHTIYGTYQEGQNAMNALDYALAMEKFELLYGIEPTEENLLYFVLAKYKLAEQTENSSELYECLHLIKANTDIETSNSEQLFGRLAAINLRIYNLLNDKKRYYDALYFYWKGSTCPTTDLYCPRNYCALLLRIHEITDDINIIREYYYTAIHFAKVYENISIDEDALNTDVSRLYYYFNRQDLALIKTGDTKAYESSYKRLEHEKEVSPLQKETVMNGCRQLAEDVKTMKKLLSIS